MELAGELVVAPHCVVLCWFRVVREKVAEVGEGACEEGRLVESSFSVPDICGIIRRRYLWLGLFQLYMAGYTQRYDAFDHAISRWYQPISPGITKDDSCVVS